MAKLSAIRPPGPRVVPSNPQQPEMFGARRLPRSRVGFDEGPLGQDRGDKGRDGGAGRVRDVSPGRWPGWSGRYGHANETAAGSALGGCPPRGAAASCVYNRGLFFDQPRSDGGRFLPNTLGDHLGALGAWYSVNIPWWVLWDGGAFSPFLPLPLRLLCPFAVAGSAGGPFRRLSCSCLTLFDGCRVRFGAFFFAFPCGLTGAA
jgi:hypothetical protein